MAPEDKFRHLTLICPTSSFNQSQYPPKHKGVVT